MKRSDTCACWLLVGVLLWSASLGASPGLAQDSEEEDGQGVVALLLKVLAFDRNLKSRSGDGIRIGVIYNSSDEASLEEFDAVGTELSKFLNIRVAGLPLTFIGLDAGFDDVAKVSEQFRLNVFFVCSGNDPHLESLQKVARKRKAVTTSQVRAYIEQGFSIGLGTSTTSASTVQINLAASIAEGAQFDINFLQLTEVLR